MHSATVRPAAAAASRSMWSDPTPATRISCSFLAAARRSRDMYACAATGYNFGITASTTAFRLNAARAHVGHKDQLQLRGCARRSRNVYLCAPAKGHTCIFHPCQDQLQGCKVRARHARLQSNIQQTLC